MLVQERNLAIEANTTTKTNGVRKDNLAHQYRSLVPGLYTYPIYKADGSYKRLHLRVEPTKQGVLFVDVTDVIHLNQVACKIVKMALDGISQDKAEKYIQKQYRGNRGKIQKDVAQAYEAVNHLAYHDEGCHTCGLVGLMDSSPLFSVPVNAPYKIDIALTYGCNNQCPHCYNETSRLPMASLPLSHWYKVLDKIAELGVPHLILTGGEATLHPDFPEIVRYADGLGMIVGLNSNGRYLGHAPFMQQVARAGLNHVQITLGSCYEEVHDAMMGAKSFHQTVKGITTAIESGVHTITNTTLMRSNIGHVEEIVDFLYDLGIRTFAMNGMIYSGGGYAHPNAISAEEMYSVIWYVRELAEARGMKFMWYTPTEYCRLSPMELEVGVKKCNAAEYSICIEPNGDVLPCQSYYVAAGNILTDPWEEIWQGDLFQSFRNREENPAEYGLPEKCWDCPDLMICGSGCRIERDAESGIRVAETAGGGCMGCSGYIPDNSKTEVGQPVLVEVEDILPGSFVPNRSQINAEKRSSGEIKLKEDI